MDSTVMPRAIGQGPFYFYNTESKHDVRQYYPQQMYMSTGVPTPIYCQPSYVNAYQPPTLYSNGPAVMNSIVLPQPMSHKLAIPLKNTLYGNSYFPSTPALSTTGSTVDSPGAHEILRTPMNPMFSGLDDLDGFKETLEPVDTAVPDWSKCISPPMTPVYLQSQLGKVPSLNDSASDVLSTPSDSSSPVPYARSVPTPDLNVDFCDPRNLTVGTGAITTILAPEFCANKIKVEPKIASQYFDFAPVVHGLPTFEDFLEFDSEDDFVNILDNLAEQPTNASADITRPQARTGSSVVSLGRGNFNGDEDVSFEDNVVFQVPSHSSPPSTCAFEDCHKDKRVKKSQSGEHHDGPVMNVAPTSVDSGNNQESSNQAAEGSDFAASSGSEGSPAPLPAPANRRGRKQSFTEDPSKKFACDLCNWRFRRREQLRRHGRSIHTKEKPFECYECGKEFARSDNLAQHARTHGGGTPAINPTNEHSYSCDLPLVHATDDYRKYSKGLFQINFDVPGSASELSPDEGNSQGKEKRKRSD